MTLTERITEITDTLADIRDELMREHREDGYGSKPMSVRHIETAVFALEQVKDSE